MIDISPAQRLREVEYIGPVVTVEDDRPHRLAPQCVSGSAGHVTAGARYRDLAVGEAGGADRLERALDVQAAVAVDRVHPGRAEIVGSLEEDGHDLLAGEVRECLSH